MSKKYMLISVCERDICTEQFDNFEDARKQMMKELEQAFGDFEIENEDFDFEDEDADEDNAWLTWDDIKNLPEYDGGCDFYFCEDNAWSNIDDDYKWDWQIVKIN